MRCFEKKGPENTEEALLLAFKAAQEKGINHVVVASTRGETALKAITHAERSKVNFIVVTHNNWFLKEKEQQFDRAIKEKVEQAGGTVFTGTLILRGLGRALRNVMGYSQEEIVALTFRMVCQGLKVCCEMSAMVCDAGLVSAHKDVICVAGTGSGADTVCVVTPDASHNFFDIRVKEIIAKPALG